jgi:hypothetical protein
LIGLHASFLLAQTVSDSSFEQDRQAAGFLGRYQQPFAYLQHGEAGAQQSLLLRLQVGAVKTHRCYTRQRR